MSDQNNKKSRPARSHPDRSRPDRSHSDRSHSDRPRDDESPRGKKSDKPARPGGPRPGGSHTGKPGQDKGGEGHSRPDKGRPDRPGKPGSDKGRPDRPGRPGSDKGRPDRPGKPGSDKGRPDRPGSDKGRPDRPDRPGSDKGRPDRPGTDKGRPDRPGRPGSDKGRPDRPGTDKGRLDRPGSDRDWSDNTSGQGRGKGSGPRRPHSEKQRPDAPYSGKAGAFGGGKSGGKNISDRATSQDRNRPGMPSDMPRAPRPASYATVWRGATPLFPPLTEEARQILDQLPEVLARVWPLSTAHRRSLPDDVAGLSRLLTTERAALDRPYWGTPAFISAYLYYFLPWNLVRLTRLLAAMPLPDPHLAAAQGGKALLLDVGSGPLTLPLALWLARPQWRQAPIQVLALDNSSQPLELGRNLLKEVAALTYHQPWAVQTVRAPLEQAARQAAPLLAEGARPWLVSAANVLNELRFGKRGGRASTLDDYEDDLGAAGRVSAMDSYGGEDHAAVPGQGMDSEERPDDCRQEKLVRFLDTLAPLFRTHRSAKGRPEDQPAGPALLFVEPGTRLGGSTIMDLRQLAVEGGLTALAPCTHQADCPLLGRQGGRTWCHFTFGSEDAPRWLEKLSAEAGLAKSGLSLAPLLLSAAGASEALAGAEGQGRKASGSMQARVLTAPFAVPGLAGRGRYACAACGMLLLEDAEGLDSGSLLEVNVSPDARRDAKSGARVVRRPGGGSAPVESSLGAPASRQQPFPARNSRRPQWRDNKGGKKS